MVKPLVSVETGRDYNRMKSGAIDDAAATLKVLEGDGVWKPRRKKETPVQAAEQGEESVRYVSGRGRKRGRDEKSSGRLTRKMVKFVPVGGIGMVVVAAVIGLIMLISPAAKINHIIELVHGKNNFGAMVSARRTNMIWQKQLSNTATVPLTGIEARFRTMSPTTVSRFQANGFRLFDAGGNEIRQVSSGARVARIVDVQGGGRSYTAGEINAALRTNSDLRVRVERVYKPAWANWFDRTSTNFKRRFGLFRNNSGITRPQGDTVDKNAVLRQKATQTRTNTGVRVSADTIPVEDGNVAARQMNEATQQRSNQINRQLQEFSNDGGAGARIRAGQLLRWTAGLSMAQLACDVLGMVNFVNQHARGAGAEELMQSFMQLGAVGGQIQANTGSADPEIISAVANRINEPSSYENEDGTMSVPRSGTMGQAFMYVSGERAVTQLNGSTRRFVTGGFDTMGPIAGFVSRAAFYTAGMCGVITNPAVRITTTIVGLGLTIYTAGATAILSGAARVFLTSQGASYAMMLTQERAVRALGGQMVGPDMVGQEYLDATIIGGLHMNGRAALAGGVVGIGREGAQQARAEYQVFLAQKAEDERRERSPFDVTSRHTFLGSIAHRVLPHAGTLNSVGGVFTMIGSLTGRAMRTILPTASALDAAEFALELDVCEDRYFRAAGIATDPFCNPLFSIPVAYLDMDPEDVLRELERRGEIEIAEDGRPTILNRYFGNPENAVTGLRRFETYCVNRRDALMVGQTDDQRGLHCIARDGEDNRLKVLYSLFFVDGRIMENLNGDGMRLLESATETSRDIPIDAGCDDEQSCAARLVELIEDGSVVVDERSGLLEHLREIARTGEAQPTVCVGQGIGRESMVVDVRLLSVLIRMAERYEMVIGGFGFEGDELVRCDGGYHTRGFAVKLLSISDGELIDFSREQVSEISAFVRDFVGAVRSQHPSARVHIGQSECSPTFGSSLRFPGIFQAMGRSCDHLYLAVVP